jgi:hypothetical protein
MTAGGPATGASSKSLRFSCTPPSAYRGPQQKLPGCPTSAVIPGAPLLVKSSRKCVKSLLLKRRMTPHRALPGSPTRITGASNKNYRGPQQKLPGSSAKSTGVPDKDYRGAQQKLPGCPTSRLGESPASKRIFCFPRRLSVLLCLVVVYV